MPSTKRRIYTRETLEAITQRFDAAPPAPESRTELGAPALVRALVPKLRQMTEKGYSWQAIATMMADCGVPLSPNVLRKYAAARPDNAKTKKGTRGGASSRSSRPRTVPMPARVPTATATEGLTAADETWEDIESVEETDRGPADSLGGALPSTRSASPSEAVEAAAAASTGSSSLRTRSDVERR